MSAAKSWTERCLQTLLFEALAIVLSTLVFARIFGTSLRDMGMLSVAVSLAAILWNLVYNALFDRLRQKRGFTMTLPVRAVHALGFELGLTVVTLPLGMLWLGLDLAAALGLEIGGILFFFVYTALFTWSYDMLRPIVFRRWS